MVSSCIFRDLFPISDKLFLFYIIFHKHMNSFQIDRLILHQKFFTAHKILYAMILYMLDEMDNY